MHFLTPLLITMLTVDDFITIYGNSIKIMEGLWSLRCRMSSDVKFLKYILIKVVFASFPLTFKFQAPEKSKCPARQMSFIHMKT